MAAQKTVIKAFEDFKGLHKGYSALTRPKEFTSTAKNVLLTDKLLLKKRTGGKVLDRHSLMFGLAAYSYLDSSTAMVEKLFSFDYPGTLKTGTVAIAYSGAGTALVSFLPASGSFTLTVAENGVNVLVKSYGTGLPFSGTTLATLESDISGIVVGGVSGHFTCTATPKTDVNKASTRNLDAAILPIIQPTIITAGGTLTVAFEYIDHVTSAYEHYQLPPATRVNSIAKTTPPSSCTLNDCLYFCCGRGNDPYLYKYDGLRVYKAGLPVPNCAVSSPSFGAGAGIAAGVYKYRARLKRTDARGNVIMSTWGHDATDPNKNINMAVTAPGACADIRFAVAVADLTAYAYQHGLHAATVNGNQTDTSILVDAGHTVVAGDTVWVVSAGVLTSRMVSSVDATHVVLDSSVNVLDNSFISNITMEVYRTKVDSENFYYVEECPIIASIAYMDNKADANLTENLIEPAVDFDICPGGSFLCAHQGLLVVSGHSTRPNRVYFSDVAGPEYFPLDTNYLDMPFIQGGGITGLASVGDTLIVFGERCRAYVRGTLSDGNVMVEVKNDGIGCPSHASICEGASGLYWMSYEGPRRFVNGDIDPNFHLRLTSLFAGKSYQMQSGVAVTTAQQAMPHTQRTVGVYDYRYGRLLWCVPKFSGTPGTSVLVAAGTVWYAYDERRDAWFEWALPISMNALGGMAIYKNILYWSGVQYSGGSAGVGVIFKEHASGTVYDYADNCEPIEMDIRTQWEDGDSPSAYKDFMREKTWVLDEDATFNAFTLSVSTYRDWDEATAHTSGVTQTFSLATDREVRLKLKPGKARALQLRFYNNTIHQPPYLNGYELEVAAPFNANEVKQKQTDT